MNVTSDQSVPFLASAAALTIPIGLPTTWLCINAPNERPSCHPVYGAPWNAAHRATGEAERHQLVLRAEIRLRDSADPFRRIVHGTWELERNALGTPIGPPAVREHHPTAGLHQPLDHGVRVLGRVVGLGRVSPCRDALADLAQAGDELSDVAILGIVGNTPEVPDQPARDLPDRRFDRQSRCSGPRTHRSPAATRRQAGHPR